MAPQFGHSYWHMSHVHQSNRFEWNEHNPKPAVQKARHTKGTPPTCPKVVVGSVLEFAVLQLDLPTQSLHLRFSQLVVLFFGLPRIHLFHVSQFPLLFSRNDNRKSKMSPPKIGIGYDKHDGPFRNPIDHQFGSSLWPPWKQSDPIHWPEQCWIRQVLVCMPKVVQLSWFFLSNILLSIANVGQQTAL